MGAKPSKTSACKMMASPKLVSLADALSIDNAPFLTEQTMDWVRECYTTRLADIQAQAVLVIGELQGTQQTIDALRFRSPVYYGAHVMGAFDEAKLLAVHGYTLQDVDRASTPPPGQRRAQFAIIAPNWSPVAPTTRFHTIHAFGVNLESRKTPDYAYMMSGGALDVERYTAAVRHMLRLIVCGAARVAEAKGIEAPVVRMPLIGLGAFLSAVGNEDRQRARRVFMDALKALLPDVQKARTQLQVLDYASIAETASCGLSEDGPIRVFRGPEDGDIFAVAPHEALFLVNAWDDVSFVGNGGRNDPTIDGFMVAGSGPGRQLINCSYLHNAFFVPRLFEPASWVRV